MEGEGTESLLLVPNSSLGGGWTRAVLTPHRIGTDSDLSNKGQKIPAPESEM